MRRTDLCYTSLHILLLVSQIASTTNSNAKEEVSSDQNIQEIQFTIPIRVGSSLAPTYVLYRKNEDPEAAARNFCQQINMYNSACVSSLFSAITRRIEFLKNSDPYALTEHTTMKRVNYTKNLRQYFNALNLTDIRKGIEFFNEQGYVIFKNVATRRQVSVAKDLLWEYLESRFQAKRGKVETWDRIPANEYGIILQFGIGQSDFMWYTRTLPNVRMLFAKLWGIEETELIVDFGGPVIFRPVNCTNRWRTAEKWFHVDQNAATYPGRQTIQSFLSLTKQTKDTGGIVVIPESWKYHDDLTKRARNHWGTDADAQFLLVPPSDEVLSMKQPRFLHVDPGDVSSFLDLYNNDLTCTFT